MSKNRRNEVYNTFSHNIINETTFFKANEVEGKTNYKLEEIIQIAIDTTESLKDKYEIDVNTVMYDLCDYITGEPAWSVWIIATLNKERWPDAYESLVISDIIGKAIYIMNNHGIAHEISL